MLVDNIERLSGILHSISELLSVFVSRRIMK